MQYMQRLHWSRNCIWRESKLLTLPPLPSFKGSEGGAYQAKTSYILSLIQTCQECSRLTCTKPRAMVEESLNTVWTPKTRHQNTKNTTNTNTHQNTKNTKPGHKLKTPTLHQHQCEHQLSTYFSFQRGGHLK